MAAMNEPAETALRVNTLRAEPARVAADLRRDGLEVTGPGAGGLLDPADGLVVDLAPDPVGALIATGEIVPQSRGSQAVVALLDPRPGERVLDLCAGPGIKTTAIAARMRDRGEVVSIEVDPRRAAEIESLCSRAGATCVRVEVADATEADLGSGYDRILLDPPCSDLGTLASRPDARWRRSAGDPERLAAIQRRLLVRAARALRARRDAGLLDLHDLQPRERGARRGDRRVRARRRRRRPRSAAPPARLATRPALPAAASRTRSHHGFFFARFRRRGEAIEPSEAKPSRAAAAAPDVDGRRARDPPAVHARVAASRGCARPSCPAAIAASTACAATSWSPAVPNCGEHQTMVRMSADEDLLCQHCGHSMLTSV